MSREDIDKVVLTLLIVISLIYGRFFIEWFKKYNSLGKEVEDLKTEFELIKLKYSSPVLKEIFTELSKRKNKLENKTREYFDFSNGVSDVKERMDYELRSNLGNVVEGLSLKVAWKGLRVRRVKKFGISEFVFLPFELSFESETDFVWLKLLKLLRGRVNIEEFKILSNGEKIALWLKGVWRFAVREKPNVVNRSTAGK